MKIYLLAFLGGLLVGLMVARDVVGRSIRGIGKRMPCVCVRNGASSCDGACRPSRMFYGKAGW